MCVCVEVKGGWKGRQLIDIGGQFGGQIASLSGSFFAFGCLQSGDVVKRHGFVRRLDSRLINIRGAVVWHQVVVVFCVCTLVEGARLVSASLPAAAQTEMDGLATPPHLV